MRRMITPGHAVQILPLLGVSEIWKHKAGLHESDFLGRRPKSTDTADGKEYLFQVYPHPAQWRFRATCPRVVCRLSRYL